MAGKVWPDPNIYSQRIELSDDDEDDGVVTFANATATEATRQQDRQRQQEDSQQYELLASKVKSLVTKVTQLKQENTAAKTDLRVAADLNKELKLKVESLQEQQEVGILRPSLLNIYVRLQLQELETALSQVSMQAPGLRPNERAGGVAGGIKRNLDDEDRRRRAAAKSALLAGANVQEEEDDVVFSSEGRRGNVLARAQAAFARWFAKRAPLAGDVRTIQARYGSSVASYFMFYRQVCLYDDNIRSYSIVLGYAGTAQNLSVTAALLPSNTWYVGVNNRQYHTSATTFVYQWLVSSYLLAAAPAAAWLVVHSIVLAKAGSCPLSSIGVVPAFMAYSSFAAKEGLTYTAMLVLVMGLQAVTALRKWLQEDRLRCGMDLLDEEQKHIQFARTFLMGWDNSLCLQREVEDLRTSNGLQLAVLLAVRLTANTTYTYCSKRLLQISVAASVYDKLLSHRLQLALDAYSKEDKMASNSASRTFWQKAVLYSR
eukprot:16443-Heterococcus_DN1.PRE.3